MLVCKLPHRAVMRLSGKDAQKVVHNLTTIDGTGYCNFLSPQGRVLFDVFVASASGDLLLEVDRELLPQFTKHVNMYKLRQDAKLAEESDFAHVVHVTGVVPPEVSGIVLEDSRMPGAWRVYCNDLKWMDQFEDRRDGYETRRFLRGVGEGQSELRFNKSMSLENNLDRQGGVLFDKGCYLGQELVARTHTVGVVRKRLMPIVVTSEEAQNPPDIFLENGSTEQNTLEYIKGLKDDWTIDSSDIVNARGRSGGSVIRRSSQFPSLALAMVRQQYVGSAAEPLYLGTAESGLRCWPLVVK